MKNRRITIILAVALLSACILAGRTEAATLTYDESENLGWFAEDAWLDENDDLTSWADGSSAVFVNGATGWSLLDVTFNDDATVDTLSITDNFRFTPASGTQVLTLTGGQIMVDNTEQAASQLHGIKLIGDFTFTGGGELRLYHVANSDNIQFEGTATVNEGTLRFERMLNVMGSQSNFVVNDGGTLAWRFATPPSIGHVTVNAGGAIVIGRSGRNDSGTFTMASLSGTGGSIGTSDSDHLFTLDVNQASDTTYSGNIGGNIEDNGRLVLKKRGAGSLTLEGEIEVIRQTAVEGGSLYINSAAGTAKFADEVNDATAIYVNGGTLGGTGTITVTDNSNVELSATGKLAAGIAGEAGRTTYDLGTGTLGLSLATDSANEGWLLFDLGSAATAGTTYDQIRLTSGTLDIGEGLNFNDFDFTLLSGFAPGTYVLFDTNAAILGSLGTVDGELDGYESELSISGNNLVLTVIPEPGSVGLLLAGAALAVIARRRRR